LTLLESVPRSKLPNTVARDINRQRPIILPVQTSFARRFAIAAVALRVLRLGVQAHSLLKLLESVQRQGIRSIRRSLQLFHQALDRPENPSAFSTPLKQARLKLPWISSWSFMLLR